MTDRIAIRGGRRWRPPFFLVLFHLLVGPAWSLDPTLLAQSVHLAGKSTWQSLLHLHDGRRVIEDPRFLLSLPNFSPEDELRQSLVLLFAEQSRREDICRFPARFEWLSRQLQLQTEIRPEQLCPEIAEFLRRAPAEQISLVFASENLTSPSSMMGHVLLKLSGTDESGYARDHAISYFTNIQGINVPKILFDSLVTGKPGYYTLSPYREKEEFYRRRENRNVWTYALKLEPERQRLLLLHLFELRSVRMSYFFQRHNCATLTADLIRLAAPSLPRNSGPWVSPLDVVKAVQSAGLAEATELAPSSAWQIRMLSQALPHRIVNLVRQRIDHQQEFTQDGDDPKTAYLSHQLGLAYSGYLSEEGRLSDQQYEASTRSIRQSLQERYPDYFIDLAAYKAPEKSPQDSQLRVGWGRQAGRSAVMLGVLPAAHRLEDDNRQQFGETELRLADIDVELFVESGQLQLRQFQLYSMSSLIPVDRMTGGLSGRFRIGIEPQTDRRLEDHLAANVGGGFGLTWPLSNNAWVYALAGGGVAAAEGAGYLYAEPELGFVAREIGDMKTLLDGRMLYNQLGDAEAVYALRWRQIKYLGTKYALVAEVERKLGPEMGRYDWQLSLKRYF